MKPNISEANHFFAIKLFLLLVAILQIMLQHTIDISILNYTMFSYTVGKDALQMSRKLPDIVSTRKRRLERNLRRKNSKEHSKFMLEYKDLELMELFIKTGKERRKLEGQTQQVCLHIGEKPDDYLVKCPYVT